MANRTPLCGYYHRNQCPRGSQCDRLHPDNLDPTTPKEIDYQVCNEVGQGCTRCFQAGYPCDKKNRDHNDPMDPCSECRHFGGSGCRCILAQNTTQNDMLYPIMLNGATREPEYSLPKFKGREEPRSDGKVPNPMPANEIKPDWAGASKDELLATPDVLPPQVRRRPRAYLVPPRETHTKKKNRDWRARHPPGDMSFVSSPGPMQHTVMCAPQPSANRFQGPIISTTIHWPTSQAMPLCFSSHTVSSPSMHYASYPMAQAMAPAHWAPQPMAQRMTPLPVNRVPGTRQVGSHSLQGMSQTRMSRPSIRPRPTMPAPTVSTANTRRADYDSSSDIVESRPSKKSRTETTATTTRVEEWAQDVANINDNIDTKSEFSVSTMWRP